MKGLIRTAVVLVICLFIYACAFGVTSGLKTGSTPTRKDVHVLSENSFHLFSDNHMLSENRAFSGNRNDGMSPLLIAGGVAIVAALLFSGKKKEGG